jgi:hypothetical protein
MKKLSPLDCDVATELNRYRLAAPSPRLKDRVLGAAREALATGEAVPPGVAWWSPVLRLAACVAAAISVVCLAHRVDRLSLARWQPAMETRIDAGRMAITDPMFRIRPVLARLAMVVESRPTAETVKMLRHHGDRIRGAIRMTDPESPALPERHSGFPQGRLRQNNTALLS